MENEYKDSEGNRRPDRENRNGWPVWDSVTCVECPDCGFTFAADHVDVAGPYAGYYSCPACDDSNDGYIENESTEPFSQSWKEKKDWLFQNIAVPDGDYDDLQIVCVSHKRFIPCRICMYVKVAAIPYSSNLLDVKIVRDYQQGCQ